MNSITIQFNDTQNFLQSFEKFVSRYKDVSFQINKKFLLPDFTQPINTKNVENVIEEEAKKHNLTVVDYLNYMIAYEKEKALVMEDMKIMEEEIRQVNNGTLKLEPAHILLNEL